MIQPPRPLLRLKAALRMVLIRQLKAMLHRLKAKATPLPLRAKAMLPLRLKVTQPLPLKAMLLLPPKAMPSRLKATLLLRQKATRLSNSQAA